MKVILIGNAGAGKTTLANALMAKGGASRLSLDKVAFAEAAERRPLAESIEAVQDFIHANDRWVIEGVYSDIVQPLLVYCETLVFLNPGTATCIEHCRRRPWEPEKFGSESEQLENLSNLITWVSDYETRSDEYGLNRHRRLFDGFPGRKLEFTSVVPDAAEQILSAPYDPPASLPHCDS